MISLQLNDLTLRLNPSVGGSVDAFLQGNTALLRTATPGSTNPLEQAAYPLIPFSGRIDQGAFTFNNRHVKLPSNMPPEPHAIHGQGWQSVWQVVTQTERAATIALDYDGTDWPWRYRAEQTFELSKNALTVAMSLCNLSREPMPAGLGWHPFFPKEDARLTADVAQIWPSDDNLISQPPQHSPEVEQLSTGAAVAALGLDNAFSTHSPHAHMQWPAKARSISLQSSEELGHLVIYTPPDEDFFCVEPVSHAPNCVNSAMPASVTGARTLEPDETLRAHLTLTLDP